MSVLFILVPLALLLVTGAVGAFLWAAKRGQLDDLTTPAIRILHDDEGVRGSESREYGVEPLARRVSPVPHPADP